MARCPKQHDYLQFFTAYNCGRAFECSEFSLPFATLGGVWGSINLFMRLFFIHDEVILKGVQNTNISSCNKKAKGMVDRLCTFFTCEFKADKL